MRESDPSWIRTKAARPRPARRHAGHDPSRRSSRRRPPLATETGGILSNTAMVARESGLDVRRLAPASRAGRNAQQPALAAVVVPQRGVIDPEAFVEHHLEFAVDSVAIVAG